MAEAAHPARRAPIAHPIAAGAGWAINHVVCRLGPQDCTGEEQMAEATIAVVLEGTFQYRAGTGAALLYPGAFLLGNAGACFTCGHEHGVGDRCIAFHFDAALFEEIAATAAGSGRFRFTAPMLPATAALAAPAVASALRLVGKAPGRDEELALDLAERVIRLVSGHGERRAPALPRERRRLVRALRYIEEHSEEPVALSELAAVAGMSKYHFLRSFRALMGVTPHQLLIARRLRRAALAVATSPAPISAIAYEAGFGDLSTFNARFRNTFGVSPSELRRRA
jgi:AraC family transcriptional regulator